MIKTNEELVKAIRYLNKKSMSCNPTSNPPSKEVKKLLHQDITIEEFNEEIVSKLDFENKYKLNSMLRQNRYNKENPKKSIKIKQEIANRFDEMRAEKSIDEFMSDLLENYSQARK